jgi:hypothetical protein
MKMLFLKTRLAVKKFPTTMDENGMILGISAVIFMMAKVFVDIYLEYKRNQP